MKEKEKKLWLELYDLAKDIQDLGPWNYLWDSDLLVFNSKELGKMFYCCVMGKAGLHKSIAIYTNEQVFTYLDLLENHFPEILGINYQQCLTCNFLPRDEILPQNIKIIKDLGLKFRGTWISFECFEGGYEPHEITIEQVILLKEVLKNFYEMFKTISEKKIVPNFDEGELLMRAYDAKTKGYCNFKSCLLTPLRQFKSVTLDDKELLKKVSHTHASDREIEYEFMNCLPFRMTDLKDEKGRYYYPKIRMLFDRKIRQIVRIDVIDIKKYESEDDYIKESVKILAEFILKTGRPKVIYVRDLDTENILRDFCEKTKITLVRSDKLEYIDQVHDMMVEDSGLFG